MTTTDHRLSRDCKPSHYEVLLETSPRRKTFSGEVTVVLKTSHPTSHVEMHARDLSISDVRTTVRKGNRKRRMAARTRVDRSREVVQLSFNEALPRGRHEITLRFKGKLNPSMHGLYLGSDGREKAICSQCEATDARAIFPCFDEPEFKATIGLTVRTDPGMVVIANGVPDRVTRSRSAPKTETHRFKKTRVISTYLFALTVGKYDVSKPKRVCRIQSRVVCGPGKLDQTGFAQEVTEQVLPWYETYFGHRYHYQKLDQVAVPGFDAGAMENVGAIFYRRSLLLMDPSATSWAAQKRIAEVIAHEIAHQWFGNLVTMKWWDDLWLNEAFATWVAYKAVHAWRPDWRMWDDYLEHKESALGADAMVNTHPIYTEVSSPAEATELFDIITYEKGCAVLRMAESFLGEKTFQKGIQRYIQAHANNNAQGRDLWNALADAAKQPVDALMQSWIRQAGFPLVSAHTERRAGKTVLHLSQRRFFADPQQMDHTNEQLWQIPMVIRYATARGTSTKRFVLSTREATMELPGDVRWVHPNDGATGFYRAELAEGDVNALLAHGLVSLSPATRMSLIEDQWALVRNGRASVSRFMDVLAAFRGETDHIVVRAMVARLACLDERLVDDDDRPFLAAFVRWLFDADLRELGWEPEPGESPSRAVRRSAIVGALGQIGRAPEVLAKAQELTERERVDPTSVEANLAGTVIALAAIDGDAKMLDRFVEEFLMRQKRGDAPELQARYLGSLSEFERPAVARKVLRLCLDGTVPQEQLRVVLNPMLSRRANQTQAWSFLKKNWAELAPRIGTMGMARLVETTGCLPPSRKNEVRRFFTTNPVDEARRALEKALEAMSLRESLVTREGDNLGAWLRASESSRSTPESGVEHG